MRQITLRLSEDMLESLEGEADEHGVSRSEYIRDTLDSRHEADGLRDEYETRIDDLREEHAAEVDELRTELDRAEARIDDLQNQLAAANQRIDAANDLVEYVRDERTAEQRRREAGALKRFRWWLGGMPQGDEDRGE